MMGIWATLKRELRAYFFSPLAYVVGAFLLIINGIVFAIIISYLADPRFPAGRPLDYFFGGTWLFWLVLIFVAPVLTMRLLAEERRSGSIEVLMTAPVTETHVVLGKYLAALAFYVFLWLPTVVYAILVDFHSEIDWRTVAAGYLGILGVGAMFLAAGMLASALSRSQLVAAMVTFALLFAFFGVVFVEGLVNSPVAKEIAGYLSLRKQMQDFSMGIVDSRYLVYDLSMTVFFLFLTTRALAAKKWR
jgi:gliding motility-associated transport system permease protein